MPEALHVGSGKVRELFTLGDDRLLLVATDRISTFDVVLPTGLASPRGFFNLDWITLFVMFIIVLVGAIYFFIARPDRGVRTHLHDEAEATGAERA